MRTSAYPLCRQTKTDGHLCQSPALETASKALKNVDFSSNSNRIKTLESHSLANHHKTKNFPPR
jgi:hypothetical protein